MTVYVSEPTGGDQLANAAADAFSKAPRAAMDWTRRANPLVEQQLNRASESQQAQAFRTHPVFRKVMEKYAAKLESGEAKAEDVFRELQAELDAYNRTVAPVTVKDDTVPVTQPAAGDRATLSQPMQPAPQPQTQAGPALAQQAPAPAQAGSPGSYPSASPNQGMPIQTPMGQANSVASQVMGGATEGPQVARPESVGTLGGGVPPPGAGPAQAVTQGPTLTQQVPQDLRLQNTPVYERELGQFQGIAPFLSAAQRPGIEQGRAMAAKETARAKLAIEQFKQTAQDQRLMARLDTMLSIAQSRLDESGQRMTAHMTETLLKLEAEQQRVNALIAARQSMKEGDWKIEMRKIAAGYSQAADRALATIATSLTVIADPEVQKILQEQRIKAEQAKAAADAIQQEIGNDRNSPALETGTPFKEMPAPNLGTPKQRGETTEADPMAFPSAKGTSTGSVVKMEETKPVKKSKKEDAPPPKKKGKKFKTRINPQTGLVEKVEE